MTLLLLTRIPTLRFMGPPGKDVGRYAGQESGGAEGLGGGPVSARGLRVSGLSSEGSRPCRPAPAGRQPASTRRVCEGFGAPQVQMTRKTVTLAAWKGCTTWQWSSSATASWAAGSWRTVYHLYHFSVSLPLKPARKRYGLRSFANPSGDARIPVIQVIPGFSARHSRRSTEPKVTGSSPVGWYFFYGLPKGFCALPRPSVQRSVQPLVQRAGRLTLLFGHGGGRQFRVLPALLLRLGSCRRRPEGWESHSFRTGPIASLARGNATLGQEQLGEHLGSFRPSPRHTQLCCSSRRSPRKRERKPRTFVAGWSTVVAAAANKSCCWRQLHASFGFFGLLDPDRLGRLPPESRLVGQIMSFAELS
jgi:hypothetical protein